MKKILCTVANLGITFYPRLKIGFELNGVQHRKKVSEEQWSRDKTKKKLCGKAGVIRLVVYKKELSECNQRAQRANPPFDCIKIADAQN